MFAKVLHHRSEVMAKIDENLIIHFFLDLFIKLFPVQKNSINMEGLDIIQNLCFVNLYFGAQSAPPCARLCVVPTVSERKRDMEEIGDKLPPRPSDLQFVRGGIAPLKHALR